MDLQKLVKYINFNTFLHYYIFIFKSQCGQCIDSAFQVPHTVTRAETACIGKHKQLTNKSLRKHSNRPYMYLASHQILTAAVFQYIKDEASSNSQNCTTTSGRHTLFHRIWIKA